MALRSVLRNSLKAIVLVVLIMMLLVVTLSSHVHEHVGDALEWIQTHKAEGTGAFIGLYVVFAGRFPRVTFKISF